jgi:lysophospholipase L1-like esterase
VIARILAPVAMLAVSSCAALGVAELAVRVALPQYLAIQTDRAMWEHDERLGWIGRPGTEVWQGFDADHRVPVRLNSRGFRDDEPSERPPPGRRRVLVLGDSVAFGYGVALEERFTERVERERGDVELVNLGVSGYSTDQELLLWREHGLEYRPDAVVLVFVVNDLHFNGRPLGHGHPKPTVRMVGDELVLGNVPVPESGAALRAKYFLMRHSGLFNLLRERLRSAARETGLNELAGDEALAEAAGGADPIDAEALTRRLVAGLRDEVEAAGARFLVLLAITNADLSANQDANERLLAWCRESGVACADTYPAFRDHARAHPDDVLFLQDRSHWSPLGHEIAARVLAAALVEHGPGG